MQKLGFKPKWTSFHDEGVAQFKKWHSKETEKERKECLASGIDDFMKWLYDAKKP